MPVKPIINEPGIQSQANIQLKQDFNSLNNESNSKTNLNVNNPFGDSFSQLNDNEIFGLEFDKLRQKNEKNSPNSLNVKSSQDLSNSNNNINKNSGNLSDKFNYYQNNQKSSIKSNSCINIRNPTNTIIDQITNDNDDFNDNDNDKNNNRKSGIFITHF